MASKLLPRCHVFRLTGREATGLYTYVQQRPVTAQRIQRGAHDHLSTSASPTKRAPVAGFVFGGMGFPVTASAGNCEFLRVATSWWGEVWIVGPPEYATIEHAGCADLPDQSLGRGPQG